MTTATEEKEEEIRVTTRNVKLSCKIRLTRSTVLSFHTDKGGGIRHYSNFSVVKRKYSFVVFTKTGGKKNYHVNITKVPDFESIPDAIAELAAAVIKDEFVVEEEKIRVENVTCTHHAPLIVNLKQLYRRWNPQYRRHYPVFRHVSYRPEKFPGMFFKLKPCTILLFSNGK